MSADECMPDAYGDRDWPVDEFDGNQSCERTVERELVGPGKRNPADHGQLQCEPIGLSNSAGDVAV
jgi:hypothetical protein